jgi:hypothetical protein
MKHIITLTCIIPFASRAYAKNWNLACLHLKQTVLSILNSQDHRLAVVVVGNDHPGEALPLDDRIHFIAAKLFSDLETVRDTATMVRDQVTKMEIGWEYVQKHLSCRYVMRMDADDLISRKVVGFLSNEDKPGYRVSDGWIWNSGDRWLIEKTERFDLLCGSSNVFRFDVAGKVLDINRLLETVPDHILAAIPDLKCTLITNRFHAYAGKAMELCGLQIDRLPFGAAVYRVGNVNSEMQRTVQSHSVRFLLGRIRRLRFLSPTIRKEFALY